jgi:hypothetical protein
LGEEAASSPKLGLKSYIVWAEIRALHAIVTGFPPTAAVGVALGAGEVALAEGELEASGDGVVVL